MHESTGRAQTHIVGLLPLHYIFYLGQCLDGYFLDFVLASRSTTVAAVAHRPHMPHDFIFRIILFVTRMMASFAKRPAGITSGVP